MLITLWILNVVLALAFLAAGVMKSVKSKAALAEGGMAWTEDFSSGTIRAIGVLEIIGALGVILPLATGIAPLLTPIAAVCLTVIMAGATVVHLRRHEKFAPALVLTVLVAASAALGFFVVAS